MQICWICLRLDMSSLTEIRYLQIKPSEKGTHTNDNMMLEVFCLNGFVRWTKCIWWTKENNYLLACKLFEFAVEWIPATRIKQKLSSVQKITRIIAIADKKIISVFCVSGVLRSAPQYFVQIKWFLQLGSIFSCNRQRKRKKS